MEIFYWWLISLPIFFALGWVAARIDIREILREARSLPRAFAQSYRNLAEADPESALKPFIGAKLSESVSFELLLSLGVLYRRQGQFAEAIRLHEALHQRVDLNPTEIDEVVWELTQDYLKAGMLDRSVMCIQALHTTDKQNRAVLTMMEIFQLQKQWDKALEYANKVTSLLGIDEHQQCSHFHCELALRAHQRMDEQGVAHHLMSAQQKNPRNVRVAILRGEFALASKDYVGAINAWKVIEESSPNFLLLVIDKMHEAFTALEQSVEEERLLTHYFETNPSAPLLMQVTKILGQRLSGERLMSWVDQYENALQSWQTFNVVLEHAQTLMTGYEGAGAGTGSMPSRLLTRLQKLSLHNRPQHFGYICDHCGFLLQNHVWRCPGCGHWDTYPPIPRSVT